MDTFRPPWLFNRIFHTFWERHPALLIGLMMTLGSLVAFGQPWALFPAILLFLTLIHPLSFGFFFLTLFTIPAFYQFPDQEVKGQGVFTISAISPAKRGGWIYKGTLQSFTEMGKNHPCARRLTCSIFSKQRVPADVLYQIEGTLKHRRGYVLKGKKEWVPLYKTNSLAEKRLGWKERTRRFIAQAFPNERAAAFLAGLATGELQDRTMFKEFGALGVSHLLAISGFHFSLLALFFHFFLKHIFSFKKSAILLIGALTSYLFFLGQAPSVLRAWIASSLFFLGHIVEKPSRALNSLGVGLIIAMLIDPLLCQHLGFQLSFLATSALLLCVSPIDALLQVWIPKRSFSSVSQRSLLFQMIYISRSLFREAMALGLAVHIALLPLLIALFHQFNLHSLLYNLFFPFLVSLSMLLFLFTLPFTWIFPPLGNALHAINSFYTHLILIIPESPFFLSRSWYVEHLSDAYVTITTTLFFAAIILWNGWREHKRKTNGLELYWI